MVKSPAVVENLALNLSGAFSVALDGSFSAAEAAALGADAAGASVLSWAALKNPNAADFVNSSNGMST